MMENIQSTLDKLASQSDRRTSVFDIEIVRLQNKVLTLGGQLLEESQLDSLASQFPQWKLDTAAIRILRQGDLPRMYVATNLTGLYEKPTFGMPLSSEMCFGTELEILDEQAHWVFTRQKDGYLGWAYKAYLANGTPPEVTHLVLASSYGLRTQPDRESKIVTRVMRGAGVCVEEIADDWAKVVANQKGWMPESFLRPVDALPDSLEEKRKAILEDSARMIGVPYLWGGSSGNGIDCSGLSRLLHRWIGIDIPRDADMQHEAARPIEPPFEIGDLLFFAESGNERRITHAGISLGGWSMIHSSRARNGVYIEDVQQDEARRQAFVSAGSFLR
jgi:hypothetical protein